MAREQYCKNSQSPNVVGSCVMDLTCSDMMRYVLQNAKHNPEQEQPMARSFGETIREMREAQEMGLRAAANHLGISPAYLSRIERGRERPPKPKLVKRIATLLGGDPDLLFRLAESTDPDLADYIHLTPNVPEFLRTAKAMDLTSEDFEVLIEQVKRRRPSEEATTGDHWGSERAR